MLTAIGPSGNLYVALGDVTGHGLPAAIGAIPAYQSFRTTANKGMSVGSIAAEMNKAVCTLLPDNMLMAMVLIEFNSDANLVNIWAGGMPPIIWADAGGRLKQQIESRHGPLAMFDEQSFSSDISTIRVEPGDKLYLLTDGIEECRNPENEMFGESRVLELFDGNQPDMFQRIIDAMEAFSGDSERDDDITLVELTCTACDVETTLNTSTQSGNQHDKPVIPWQLEIDLGVDELRSLNPVPLVARMLTNAIGIDIHRDYISTIMSELYCNALEHGLLSLDSGMKQDPEGFFEFYNLRKQRLNELNEGSISIKVRFVPCQQDSYVSIEIQDSGDGFDFQSKNSAGPITGHGHGINIVTELCECIEYSNGGSRVNVIYLL